MKDKQTKLITFSLDEKLCDKIEKKAEQEERSVSFIVRKLVERGLEK